MADTSLVQRLTGKRVGVVLSAGYFGFFGHAGFLKALEEVGLVPACLGGSSAGALVAALAASGLDSSQVGERLARVARRDFWDPDPVGIVGRLFSSPAATGLLRGARFRDLLERSLPVRRFEDCRIPLLVVATNLDRSAAQGFTKGELAPRVHASCAYPGLFRAVEVEGEHFWDGGLVDKAPVLALHEAFRPEALLVHYLPSRARAGAPRGPLAYARGVSSAYAALRRDHFDLQLELLRRSGVPVAVVTSQLDGLGPTRLERGPKVAEQAHRMALEALTRPAREIA